jgi:hypothetical protein
MSQMGHQETSMRVGYLVRSAPESGRRAFAGTGDPRLRCSAAPLDGREGISQGLSGRS